MYITLTSPIFASILSLGFSSFLLGGAGRALGGDGGGSGGAAGGGGLNKSNTENGSLFACGIPTMFEL